MAVEPNEPDYTIYKDKEPTDLQARFSPWITEKTGYSPAAAKTKQEAFEAGVRLAVTLRIPFQASPENRDATEQRRQSVAEERAAEKARRDEERAAKAAEREEALAARQAEKEAKAAERANKVAATEEAAPTKPAKPAKAVPAATPAKAAAAAPVRGRGRGARPQAAASASPF